MKASQRGKITTPKLCKAGQKLRSQINATYPKRDKSSDGWIGDLRHQARPSDHNPDENGIVRAIDVDADLTKRYKDASWDLAEELRLCAKSGDKRILYIIHHGKIASPRMGWRWRTYKGNPHIRHFHISFTPSGDTDGKPFQVESLKK